MSLIEKLIIPFIDENMKREYVSDKYNFVGCYTMDKNNPQNASHIFLLYEFTKGISLYNIFSKFKTFHSSKCIFIKEKAYYLYTFCRINQAFTNLVKGLIPCSDEALIKLYDFWKDDKEIVHRVLNNELVFSYSSREIPEEDYRFPSPFDADENEERLALDNESQPLLFI